LYLPIWAATLIDWWWTHLILPGVTGGVLAMAMPLALVILLPAMRGRWRWDLRLGVLVSLHYLMVWQSTIVIADLIVWHAARAGLARYGLLGLFCIGLGWIVWLLERAARRYRQWRLDQPAAPRRTLNPLDPDARYYGPGSRKLKQSLAALIGYTVLFSLAVMLISQVQGCREVYELPGGGGQPRQLAQTVRIQKVIRKKFVVNPYSVISFKVPPIDEVKLQLNEITKHAYSVGYGGSGGDGAGFGPGTELGKVRFIRLEYAGGDWNQDFGVGADLNMLIEYGIRTGGRVANRTESRTVAELGNFKKLKSPPLVYLTGQKSINLSSSEIKILREYLLDKHGMLFGDNGGSRHFHRQFLSMMNKVLPDVRPVPVPLDDAIHRVPYQLPFLPYVAPHGGRQALGWWKNGRWLCYYHPGDIGDAWADEHASVKPEVWEACYQLGTNVIFYAHMEYAKWLMAQKQTQ
jgi:hypothetical protein